MSPTYGVTIATYPDRSLTDPQTFAFTRNPTILFVMFARSITATLLRPAAAASRPALQPLRTFTTTHRKLNTTIGKMEANHKMAVFPKITSDYPAQSDEFRRVLWTGESSQLVEMTIPVGGDIGEEVHHVDQHLIFTAGTCKAIVAGEERTINAGDICIVPQGTKHNFINIGKEKLRLFTVYAPAEHDPTSVHKTKEEGDKLEDEGKDEPPKWAQPGKN